MNRQKSKLAIIFFTVFIYLVGFGVIIPILPMLARDFGAGPLQVGLLMSVYSLMQFIFAPFWGRLSDRHGRRPILLFCLLGEFFSYLAFAYAQDLPTLFIARILSGFFGASISTASAYISDITKPEERSKGMALIGAAFGLGFLVGPALGGGLAIWGNSFSADPHAGKLFAALGVAALCLLNFVFALKFLQESLNDKAPSQEKRHRLRQFFYFLKKGLMGRLIFVFFLASLAMSTMEACLILFVGDQFDWTIQEVTFGFAYVGLVMIFSQGFLVRRLIPLFGEKILLVVGLSLMVLGLSFIGFLDSIWMLAISQTLLAFGFSFTNPSALGSISLLASSQEQGEALGTAQSGSSLGRILGPAAGGWLYSQMRPAPFFLGGMLALVALAVVIGNFLSLPNSGKKEKVVL